MLGLGAYADSDEEGEAAEEPEPGEVEPEEPSPSRLLQQLAAARPNGLAEAPPPEAEKPVHDEELPEVELPPSPRGECSADRLANVQRLIDLKAQGRTINAHMRADSQYRNPHILEKIIKVFDIDEAGTSVPAEVYDPNAAIEAIGYYDDANFGKPKP